LKEIRFYAWHGPSLEHNVFLLSKQAYCSGFRATIYSHSHERIKAISNYFWMGQADFFLPHLCEGSVFPAYLAPLWLALECKNKNGASICIVSEDISPANISDYWRIFHFFPRHYLTDDPDFAQSLAQNYQQQETKQCAMSFDLFSQQDSGKWHKMPFLNH
jgi:DNA polymerase IIIc chi subunit